MLKNSTSLYLIFTLEAEVGSNAHLYRWLLWDLRPKDGLYCIETLSVDCFEFFSRTDDIRINPLLPQVTLFHFPQNQETGKTLLKEIW